MRLSTMHKLQFIAILALIASAALFAAPPGGKATINVDVSKRADYTIPRTIFGTFHEPIGNSNYGGLWAQLLKNPSFEEILWSARNVERMVKEEPALRGASQMGLPFPWQPLNGQQGWRYEPSWTQAANSSRSLLVMAMPDSQTGVRQEVYLPVQRIRRYTGYVYVKPVTGDTEVEVSLRGRNKIDEVFARSTLAVSGSDWKKYEFELEVPEGKLSRNEPADFVIALSNSARALIDQAFLYPADHIDGLDPEMVELSREMKTPLLRYGGNFTSGYHWRDGVGPMDERISMINQSWGIPEYNHFGTDEFLRFCELIKAEPQICLNLGSGTPQEAAEWVEYVNRHWGDRRGGLLWELGNELWGDWQIGYPTLEELPGRTAAFSKAVRNVDPRVTLIATGQDPDVYEKWNAAQLTIAPDAYSYLATHFVVGDGMVNKEPSDDFRVEAQLALPVGLERRLRLMKEQIDAHPKARNRVKLAFTEWLFHGDSRRSPTFHNQGGALCTAGFLNTLIRVADFVPISDMTGLIEFGGVWKKKGTVYGVPAYWAFRMYSNSDIKTPVETRTEVESYDVREGNRRIPEIPDTPYLDVTATLNERGNKLTLFCVNRKTKGDIEASVNVPGFEIDSASLQELKADTIFAENNEDQPEAVIPVSRTIQATGTSFTHSFPAASVTVLELRRN